MRKLWGCAGVVLSAGPRCMRGAAGAGAVGRALLQKWRLRRLLLLPRLLLLFLLLLLHLPPRAPGVLQPAADERRTQLQRQRCSANRSSRTALPPEVHATHSSTALHSAALPRGMQPLGSAISQYSGWQRTAVSSCPGDTLIPGARLRTPTAACLGAGLPAVAALAARFVPRRRAPPLLPPPPSALAALADALPVLAMSSSLEMTSKKAAVRTCGRLRGASPSPLAPAAALWRAAGCGDAATDAAAAGALSPALLDGRAACAFASGAADAASCCSTAAKLACVPASAAAGACSRAPTVQPSGVPWSSATRFTRWLA